MAYISQSLSKVPLCLCFARTPHSIPLPAHYFLVLPRMATPCVLPPMSACMSTTLSASYVSLGCFASKWTCIDRYKSRRHASQFLSSGSQPKQSHVCMQRVRHSRPMSKLIVFNAMWICAAWHYIPAWSSCLGPSVHIYSICTLHGIQPAPAQTVYVLSCCEIPIQLSGFVDKQPGGTFPPNLSCLPAAPPPLFVRAAAALAANSAEVCFAGFALPICNVFESQARSSKVRQDGHSLVQCNRTRFSRQPGWQRCT